MPKRTYDIAVKVGTYEKDGETKNKYKNVGVILKGDTGSFILLDRTFNPAGAPIMDGNEEKVLLSLFEPKEKEEKPQDDGSSQI